MKLYTVLVAVAITTISCKESPLGRYDHLVTKELASGKKVDSLFMGLSFGMTSKQFFGYCWEMNKKGVFTDGNNNTAVLYKINELKYPASMNFYPDFVNNKVFRMRVSFQYDGWAP